MDSKVHYRAEAQNDSNFTQGLQLISAATAQLPTISADDKKGRKLSKKVNALVPKAIDNHDALEKYLPRDFNPRNIVDNKAALDSNDAKVADLFKQISLYQNANVKIGASAGFTLL